jgi:hypothetical protein
MFDFFERSLFSRGFLFARKVDFCGACPVTCVGRASKGAMQSSPQSDVVTSSLLERDRFWQPNGSFAKRFLRVEDDTYTVLGF